MSEQVRVGQRLVGGKQAATTRRSQRIENQLPFVGRLEAAVTRDVPRDEQVGIDLLQQRRRGRQRRIASPNQRVNRTAEYEVFFVEFFALQNGEIELRHALRRRQTVTEEHAIGRPQGQRGDSEQLQVGRVDLVRRVPVRARHTVPEQRVEILVGLFDALLRPLRQFVIPQQKMDLSRKLHLQGRDEVEQLMRLIPSRWVTKWTVDDFLQDEMPARTIAEVGPLEQDAEIIEMPVQIAGNEEFVAVGKCDDMPFAAGRDAEGVGGA